MRILFLGVDVRTSGALQGGGAIVDRVGDAEDASQFARSYQYDAIVLDAHDADDACTLVHRMRADGVATPILVVAGASPARERVRALGLGADDFVAKPFDPAELLARTRAVVRRSRRHSISMLSVGDLTLDLESRVVAFEGTPVRVLGKEYEILELLMLANGAVVTKEALLDRLYGGRDTPGERIVDVFISKLRKKLAQAGCGTLIGTVWRQGYRLSDAERAATRVTSRGPGITAEAT